MKIIQVRNAKDAAGKSATSEKDLVVSCKAVLQLQKSFNRKLTTSDQHVHVVLVVVAVLNVHIVVVIVVVVVVVVVIVVVVVDVVCSVDNRVDKRNSKGKVPHR